MNKDESPDSNEKEIVSTTPKSRETQTRQYRLFPFTLNVTYRVIRSLVIILCLIILGTGAVGVGAGLGYFASLIKTVEVPNKEELEQKIYDVEQQSRMKYADDSLISVIKSDLVRTTVSGENISPQIKQALISTEDENFYEHKGVVPKAIARATISDVLGVGGSSGGSTITQQLIKQQVLTSETSYKRKSSEIVLAMRAETFFSKEEILDAYLNVSPFGRNNRGENIAGIEEAALGVFGVHAKDVTLPQAAFLAGLPQSPIDYTPYTNTGTFKENMEAGLARKNDVLFNMYRKKVLTEQEYKDALAYDLTQDFIEPKPPTYNDQGYLYNYVYDEASRNLMPLYYEKDGITKEEVEASADLYQKYFDIAKRELRQNGYTVNTTIDPVIHGAMQEAVKQYGYILDDGRGQTIETGSVLMDNQTGRIYGFIGGRDYEANQNNHAFQTRRSPGSTIKPILAYAPAIDVGLIGSESKLSDFPLKYSSGQQVNNYLDAGSSTYKSVRESLKWSLNIPVVNLYQSLLGVADPKQYFEAMNIGLNPNEYYNESIPLGATDHGMTILEETEAFATLANKGAYNKGYSIASIVDNDGNVIYEHKNEPIQVYKPATASIMNDMMRDVLTSGTGQPARSALFDVSPTLANADWVGKTGTSELEHDYWFTASTPSVTMSSWIGYDTPASMYSTWNVQNMIYWAYMTNYVYQRSPDIFGANEKFQLDPSVMHQKVTEFTGQKPGTVVGPNNVTYDLTGAKTITSLYATDGAPISTYDFGIGGTPANVEQAWQSFAKPKAKDKPKKEKPKDSKPKKD